MLTESLRLGYSNRKILHLGVPVFGKADEHQKGRD
jgi:hypothetical protein